MSDRRRTESGFTLLEVLLSAALSAMIVLPLTAWMVLAFRQQATLTTTSRLDNGTNFLAVYLPRDVASASRISAKPWTDCPGADTPGTIVLSLDYDYQGGAGGAAKTVYTVAEGPTGGTLTRRICGVASTVALSALVAGSSTTTVAGPTTTTSTSTTTTTTTIACGSPTTTTSTTSTTSTTTTTSPGSTTTVGAQETTDVRLIADGLAKPCGGWAPLLSTSAAGRQVTVTLPYAGNRSLSVSATLRTTGSP